jgi:protein O-GlcNAc transferase
LTDPQERRLSGQQAFQAGQFAAALGCFQEALRIEPQHLETLRAAAITCLQIGRPTDGAAYFRQALAVLESQAALPHERASARFDLAVACEAGADVGAAQALYESALACHPGHFPARLNLCALLLERHAFAAAERASRELTELHREQAEAWHNRAQALLALARHDDAAAAVDRTLKLAPQHLGARCAQALLLAMQGRIEEAADRLDAIRAEPDTAASLPGHPQAAQTLGFDREALEHAHRVALFERFRQGDWACFEQHRAASASLAAALRAGTRRRATAMEAFQAMALGLAHEDYLTLVEHASAMIAEGVTTLPRTAPATSVPPGRRLRIAYLSPAFRVHATAYLFRQLFAAHDRRRFEVSAYSLSPGDGSALRAEIAAGCDRFTDLASLSDEEAARRIRADGIDILVDLEGLLEGTRPRILACRPAPLQVSWAGLLGILEASFVDYRMTDRSTNGESPAGSYRFEQPVFLPGSFFPYGCPEAPWNAEVSRRDAGLPEDRFVFCSFNNDYKIDPETLGAWMHILGAAPDAVLWLLASSDRQWESIRAFAKAHGVDPQRLFRARRLPNDDYLARLRLADLFLDSFQYNAHTTALDAIWMELPIVTRQGRTPAGRYCGSLLREVGLPDLVVSDADDYVRRAVRLATTPADLAEVRARLAAGRRNAATFSPRRKAAQIETAYGLMWSRHLSGLPPAPLEVDPGEGET